MKELQENDIKFVEIKVKNYLVTQLRVSLLEKSKPDLSCAALFIMLRHIRRL